MIVDILSYLIIGLVSCICISWILYALYRIFWEISIKELIIAVMFFSFLTFIGYIVKGIVT